MRVRLALSLVSLVGLAGCGGLCGAEAQANGLQLPAGTYDGLTVISHGPHYGADGVFQDIPAYPLENATLGTRRPAPDDVGLTEVRLDFGPDWPGTLTFGTATREVVAEFPWGIPYDLLRNRTDRFAEAITGDDAMQVKPIVDGIDNHTKESQGKAVSRVQLDKTWPFRGQDLYETIAPAGIPAYSAGSFTSASHVDGNSTWSLLVSLSTKTVVHGRLQLTVQFDDSASGSMGGFRRGQSNDDSRRAFLQAMSDSGLPEPMNGTGEIRLANFCS